jgi:small subunit ribosomal protein S1
VNKKQLANNPKPLANKSSFMDAFMASGSNKQLNFERGEFISGKVLAVTDSEIILDLNSKAEGILNKKELGAEKLEKLKTGDILEAFVIIPENESGQTILSVSRSQLIDKRRGGRDIDTGKWQRFVRGKETGSTFQGEVVEVNKGGVILDLDGLRGFIPGSQVSLRGTKNKDISGEKLQGVVIEVDPYKNKLVLASKVELSEDEAKKLKSYEIGSKINVLIKSILPFGVFTEIDGVEGFVYPQEISYEGEEKELKAGDLVEAKISNIDQPLGRLILSLRQTGEDPFEKISEKFQADDVVSGSVTEITQDGVIVALEESTSGLLPENKVGENKYTIGEKYDFLVDSIDSKQRRIILAPFLTSTKGLIYK